jgi:upstream activation factor subunit UAF30
MHLAQPQQAIFMATKPANKAAAQSTKPQSTLKKPLPRNLLRLSARPRFPRAKQGKSRNLQNPQNRREILADDKLRKVFGNEKVVTFEMNEPVAQHLK